jgi:hypothetical protein
MAVHALDFRRVPNAPSVLGNVLGGVILAALFTGSSAALSKAHAGETKSYVVNWFYGAQYSTKEDCPEGLNPRVEGLFLRILRDMGKAPAEIEKLMENVSRNFDDIATDRGKIDGKPANIYLYPTSAPDPHIKTGQGKIGFGFNLDGKVDDSDYTDPETQEKGVDNQLTRVFACFESMRGNPTGRGTWPTMMWDSPRDTTPAWLVQISGIDNYENDDEVYIGMYRALRPVLRNAIGEAQPSMTFQVDPSPRMQNYVRARIKDGMITSDVFDFFLIADPYIQPDFTFKKARVRFKFDAAGGLNGYIGGYTTVAGAYMGQAAGEAGIEAFNAVDVPGIYYALQRLSDGEVDPQTGKREWISATYRIEAVPAFFKVPQDSVPKQQTASAAQK